MWRHGEAMGEVGKGKDVEEWPFQQIYKDKVYFCFLADSQNCIDWLYMVKKHFSMIHSILKWKFS